MYETLAESLELKDGSKTDVIHVVPPDATYSPRLHAFFAHKSAHWRTYLNDSLEGKHAGTCADHFFLGLVDGEILGGMWYVGSPRNHLSVTTFGHVFTRPEARGRGIATRVMEQTCAYYRGAEGSEAMYLASGGEVPRRMYAKFGFVPVHGSIMRWTVDEAEDGDAFEARYFKAGRACSIRDADLGDCGNFEALFNSRELPLIVDHGLGVYRGRGFEGEFLKYLYEPLYGPVRVLETEPTRRVVGAALVRRFPGRHLGHIAELEFCVHAAYFAQAGDLIGSVQADLPPGIATVRCFSTGSDDPRSAVLEAQGFQAVAIEPGVLQEAEGGEKLLPLVTWHYRR